MKASATLTSVAVLCVFVCMSWCLFLCMSGCVGLDVGVGAYVCVCVCVSSNNIAEHNLAYYVDKLVCLIFYSSRTE